MTLVSERLVGDEARLEQVRRGLYILTEELINRQTLRLEDNSSAPQPDPAKRELSLLEKIQKDNFSLLSIDDVRQLTKRLGGYLSLIHDNPDLFVTPDWGSRLPLFEMEGNELRVDNSFYALTGRQATAATQEPAPTTPQTKTTDELIAEAENFAVQEGWAAKLRAINIIKQISPDKLTQSLKDFLWEVVTNDTDPGHRFAAAEQLPVKIVTQDEINTITALLSTETEERVLSIFLRLLSGASGDEARKSATDAILGVLTRDVVSRPQRKLSEGTAVEALTVLQTVASHDVTSVLLTWMSVAADTELVQTTAVSALRKISEQFRVDIADKILLIDEFFALFATGLVERELKTYQVFHPRANNVLRPYLLELLSRDLFGSVSRLLRKDETPHVHGLLVDLWNVIFSSPSEQAAIFVFQEILELDRDILKLQRLTLSLFNSTEFQVRTLPYLRRQLPELVEKNTFTADQAKTIEKVLARLAPPKYPPTKVITETEKYFEDAINRLKYSDTSSTSSFSDISPTQSITYIVTGILLFLPGFFFYKADLPAEASFGTALKSRFLLLALDGLIVYAFLSLFRWLRNPVPLGVTPASSSFFALFGVLSFAIHYLHTQYVGPLNFWPQVLQFVINWPAIAALLMAFGLLKPLSK